MSKHAQGWRKFLECTSRIRIHGHGRKLGAKIKIPISDREIGLFTDEQRIRDLFLNFPQGVYARPRQRV